MKKISIIAAALLMGTSAMAQQTLHGKHLIGKQPGSKLEKSRLLARSVMTKGNTANKSTATYQRMKALSEYGQQQQNGPVVFFDSLSFTYSGMRGSEFNYNYMSIGFFDPLTTPMIPDNKLTFFPDHFEVYVPNLAETYTFTYDIDDNVTEFYVASNSGPDERMLMTYNNSKLVYVENLVENGPDWDTMGRRYFVYDMNDMLVEDSLMENMGGNVWAINQKCMYTYDVNGNMTSLVVNNTDNMNSVYQPYEEDHYTYNVDNQMVTAEYWYYDETTTAMVPEFKDSFEYTTGFDYFTKDNYFMWDDVNSVWETDGYQVRTLNTDMKPEMAQGYSWDGSNYEQNYEEYFSYNTENNLIHDSVYLFTNGQIDEDPVYLINYYYEDYWDLGVDRTTTQSDISVYPNPVTDIMTITNSSNGAMNLQLVNALGQTVKKARSTGNAKLSMSDLTAGMYWLTVTDAKGNKLHTQAVVKQ